MNKQRLYFINKDEILVTFSEPQWLKNSYNLCQYFD